MAFQKLTENVLSQGPRNVEAETNLLTGGIEIPGLFSESQVANLQSGSENKTAPVLIVGLDHGVYQAKQMLEMYRDAGIKKPYIAINSQSHSDNEVQNVGTLSWASLRDMQAKNQADLTNHGFDHPGNWIGSASGGGVNTGITLTYIGSDATATVTISATTLTLTSSTEGAQTVTLTGQTLAQAVAQAGALAGWDCELDEILKGTESATNLNQIAATTVTKSVAAKFSSGGGIHVRYNGSAYQVVSFRKVGNTFAGFVDGVSVCSFDLSSATYNTIAKLITQIKALACFASLSASEFETQWTNGVGGYMSGNELSVGIPDFPVTACRRSTLYIQCGLHVKYVARRQIEYNNQVAADNGITFSAAMQSGGAWYDDLSKALSDIYPVIRGSSRERFVSPCVMPTADWSGMHVIHQNLFSRQKTAFTASATTDVITLGTAWALSNYADSLPVVFSGDSLPAPIVAGTWYYVRDKSGDTFKLALTAGGAAIDLTTAGSGTVELAAYYDSSRTKAILDALVDSGRKGNSFTACLLMHKLLPDGTSPYGIVSDDNYHDQTEFDWYEFLNHAKQYIESGELRVMTMRDWYDRKSASVPVSNCIFNPGFKNSGYDLNKVVSTDNGTNIPGWNFAKPSNVSSVTVADGVATFVQTSAGNAQPFYQELQLEPGEYDISMDVEVSQYTSGLGVLINMQSYAGGAFKLGDRLVTVVTSTEFAPLASGRSGEIRMRVSVPQESYIHAFVLSKVGPFDLSTNYNIKLEVDSLGSTADIDCRGATPSATTASEIAAKINTAMSAVAAYAGQYANCARVVGGRVMIESPTAPTLDGEQKVVVRAGTSLSALATIFVVGGVPTTGSCVGHGYNARQQGPFALYPTGRFVGTWKISNPRVQKVR